MIDPFGLCAEKTSTKEYNKLFFSPGTELTHIAIQISLFLAKMTKYNVEEEIAKHLDAETLRKIAKAYNKASDFFDGAGSSLKKEAENAFDRALSQSPYMSLPPIGGMGSSFSYSYGSVAVYQGMSLDTALASLADLGFKASQLIVVEATDGVASILSYFGDSAGKTADHYNNKADNKFHKTEHPLLETSQNVSGQTNEHHIFPKFRGNWYYSNFFESRGINVDDYTVTVGGGAGGQHMNSIHGRGQWNPIWKEWIDNNPNATAKDIFQFGGKMMDEYGLSGYPIHPYHH